MNLVSMKTGEDQPHLLGSHLKERDTVATHLLRLGLGVFVLSSTSSCAPSANGADGNVRADSLQTALILSNATPETQSFARELYDRGIEAGRAGDCQAATSALNEAQANSSGITPIVRALVLAQDCDGGTLTDDVARRVFASIYEGNRGNWSLARDLAREAVSQAPDYAEAHVHLGTVYMKLFELGGATSLVTEAISEYGRALRLDRNGNTHFNQGVAYASIGEWNRAMPFLDSAASHGFLVPPQLIASIENFSLHQAARGGNIEAAESLIANGARVNARALKNYGQRVAPLHYAASASQRDMVELLLSRGADVNRRSLSLVITDGRERWQRSGTPLLFAASIEDFEIVRILIDAGADVNIRDNFDTTPLIRATLYDRIQTVELLLGAGAHVRVESDFFGTALEAAQQRGYDDIVQLLSAAR